MKTLTTTAAVIALSIASAVAAPTIDAPAPNFSGVTSDGQTISLDQFQGDNVILEWTNHGCPFVQRHYDTGNMQSTQAAADEQGYIWISVISSAPGKQGHVTPDAANDLTASRNAQPDYVLLDEDGEIGRAYAAKTTPHMFLIDGDGVLRYAGAIDNKPTAAHVQADDTVNYVLNAMQNIAQGIDVSDKSTKPYGCSVKYGS